MVSPLNAHTSTCSGTETHTTFAASTNGSLTRLTVNSFVAIIFARVSSDLWVVTARETLTRGGLCATLHDHEIDLYVMLRGENE